MLTISIHLNSCTYGANPWDRGQFEGEIETIPSPIRIYRAILSGAFSINIGNDDCLKLLLRKLATELPIYSVPDGKYTRLQKYRCEQTNSVPLYDYGKMLVESHYTYPHGTRFLVSWQNANLSVAERKLLQACLNRCDYIGRSEHRATWKIETNNIDASLYNYRPDSLGNCQVQSVYPESIDSLYFSPQERNGQLKSRDFPGFFWATYSKQPYLHSVADRQGINSNAILVRIGTNGTNRPQIRQILEWCDRYHKTAISKLHAITKLRDGSVTIMPVVDPGDERYFNSLLLFCKSGFTNGEIAAIASIRSLAVNSSNFATLTVVDNYQIDRCSGDGGMWVSKVPFYLPLQPSLKFNGSRRIRQSGYRMLPGTKFIRNGVEHQALKFFLRECDISEKSISYGDASDRLIALHNGIDIASCHASIWNSDSYWILDRYCGSSSCYSRPTSSIGYKITIESSLSTYPAISIGYGKNFGLGVLYKQSSIVIPAFYLFGRGLVEN
jgi:hypothetical protein